MNSQTQQKLDPEIEWFTGPQYPLANKDNFRLNTGEMDKIEDEVLTAVRSWKQVADRIGISRAEQLEMEPAFK